jgi:carbamoyl-phosphate synthase large subunit
MKSTGEVMGIDVDPAAAIEKAFLGALGRVPLSGAALCSIADADKHEALPILRRLSELGFALYATAGTSTLLHSAGIDAVPVGRIAQSRPSVIDVIDDGSASLVVNTVSRLGDGHVPVQDGGAADQTLRDGYYIRDAAERHRIPCCTSLDTAAAFVDAIARHAAGMEFNIAPVASYRDGSVGTLKPQARAVPAT